MNLLHENLNLPLVFFAHHLKLVGQGDGVLRQDFSAWPVGDDGGPNVKLTLGCHDSLVLPQSKLGNIPGLAVDGVLSVTKLTEVPALDGIEL
jgi:hypothetical protein